MLSKERDGEDTLKNVTSWTPIQVSHGVTRCQARCDLGKKLKESGKFSKMGNHCWMNLENQ